MKPRKKRPRCLTCPKPSEAGRCGLCGTCYQAAYRMIRKGKITRAKAEERGLILKGREAKSAWTRKALETTAK